MQIIQSIRDKGAAIVITVIALSLIGFILMDARQGSNRLFGSMSDNVGKVNGETIDAAYFSKRVKEAEDMQAQRTGQRPSGAQAFQVMEQMWNQIVAEKIFFAEAEKLGIAFTGAELSHILQSDDPSNPLLQEPGMKDSATGKLDRKKAQDAMQNIKKSKGEQREVINSQVIEPLKLNTMVSRYSGLLSAGAYYPKWMQEKDASESGNFANISYVNIPYTEISDSTVKVSDEEVIEYVKKNKDLFKQEAGRNISYVTFSQLPGAEDSARTSAEIAALKPLFEADSNAKVFVSRNASTVEFTDEFVPKSKIQSSAVDTITKLPLNAVYGPYADKGSYVLAKYLGSKEVPDSAKARHILISQNDMATGQPVRSDSAAKALADSIYNAYLAGADFAQLAKTFSTDASNKDKGGDLGYFGYGAMVPEFNDYCFTKPVGSKGVVKTQFGYHVIDLLGQKDFKPAYKIAFMAKEIEASDMTINKASLEATKAAAEKTKENLEKYLTKKGMALTPLPNLIKENDYQVGQFQDARGLVKWAFEAKKGEVSGEPFNINNQFVVAVLDKVFEKGLQDAATARPGCEAMIRKTKKAEMIIKKIGANPTLESASATYNKPVQIAGADSTLTFSSQMINGVGIESKVIGAAFNKAYQTKVSPPIEGTTGVFIIKVNGVQPKNPETPEVIAQQKNSKISALRSLTNSWFEGLKKQADINDKRSTRY